MKWMTILPLLGAPLALGASKDQVDFSKAMTASELAEHFFGPSRSKKDRLPPLNVGRLGVSVKSRLNCGRIDAVASVTGELKNVENQLKETAKQIEAMFLNPSGLAMASICYYKPSVCSYIRHANLMLGDNLALAFNACQSVDSYIDSQADRGMRQVQAEGIQQCILDNSKGGAISSAAIKDCQRHDGQMRSLSDPFSMKYAQGKQKVLESIVGVVGEKSEYGLLSQMLGEVEVYQNGYWVKLFPKDQLSPKAFTQNMLAAGEQDSCDMGKIEGILNGSEPEPTDPFAKVIRSVMKERLPFSIVKDLKSLPDKDRRLVCTAIGDAVADIAIRQVVAKQKSIMSAALANDALPDDLRAFYDKRTDQTIAAVTEKLYAETIQPLPNTLEKLANLALAYREKNRSEASGVSSSRNYNEKRDAAKDCEDEVSCKN